MGASELVQHGENYVGAKHPYKSAFVLQFSLSKSLGLCADAIIFTKMYFFSSKCMPDVDRTRWESLSGREEVGVNEKKEEKGERK